MYCTLRNSPALQQCEICESKKPIETTVEMYFNHKASLYNGNDEHNEIERLLTCHDKEESEVSIKKLKLEEGEHLSQPTTLKGRLNELEKDNTMLSDKIIEAKVKTTDLSAVDLMVAQKDTVKSHEVDSISYLDSGNGGTDDLSSCSDEEWDDADDENMSWEMSEPYQ